MSEITYCKVMNRQSARGGWWRPGELAWTIERQMDPIQPAVMQAIFELISSVCGATFRQVASPLEANLIYSKAKGPRAGFDGKGGTLAYAYLPPVPNYDGPPLYCYGDMDDSFEWRTDHPDRPSRQGAVFAFNTFCHETGHLLGFDHMPEAGHLMSAMYSHEHWRPSPVEVERWQAVYGKPRGVTSGGVDEDRIDAAMNELDRALRAAGVTLEVGGRSWTLKPE